MLVVLVVLLVGPMAYQVLIQHLVPLHLLVVGMAEKVEIRMVVLVVLAVAVDTVIMRHGQEAQETHLQLHHHKETMVAQAELDHLMVQEVAEVLAL